MHFKNKKMSTWISIDLLIDFFAFFELFDLFLPDLLVFIANKS